MDVYDDLAAEEEALEAVLGGLSPQDWARPSAASGWTVADVVLHLAQTEEVVPVAIRGVVMYERSGRTVDAVMADSVAAEASVPPGEVFARWRAARRAALAVLRAADPATPVPWVETSLKPRTLATTRVAEHWAHALDVTGPLGIAYPDTARLRHVAWLGHATLPYAFRLAGREPSPVFCDLTGPDGASWRFGDSAAESVISGPAAAFCRVAAQRLAPEDSGLETRGPRAGEVLRVVRTYA